MGEAKRRKAAQVILPSDPVLDEHARVIRRLGRRCFEDAVEIGRRLAKCRGILKEQRLWEAWLAELHLSRRTANRFIALAEAKEAGNLPELGLPLSALYTLATLPPKVIKLVEERVAETIAETGAPPTVRQVLTLVAQESPDAPARARIPIYAPPEGERSTITPEQMQEGVNLLTRSYLNRLEFFAHETQRFAPTSDDLLNALPAPADRSAVREKMLELIKVFEPIIAALFPRRHLRLVKDEDDGQPEAGGER